MDQHQLCEFWTGPVCSVSCFITDINRPEVSFCLSHRHDDSRRPEGELVQRQSRRGTSLIDEYQLDQT